MHRYVIGIFYSEEDEGYIAVVPELPGCSAFGETEEEALKEIKIAMQLWLEVDQGERKKMDKIFTGDYLRFLTERVDFGPLQRSQEEKLVYEREDTVAASVFV